jgi:hypothetical protein
MISLSSVSLRVTSSRMSAQEIARTLGIIASQAHEIGDRYSPRNPESLVYDRSVCIFEFPASASKRLEEQLKGISDFLLEKRQIFENALRDCEIDILCRLSTDNGQGMFTMASGISGALSSMGVDVVFDVYS